MYNIPVSYQYKLHRFIVDFDVTIVEIWLHKSTFIHILRGINIIHYGSVYGTIVKLTTNKAFPRAFVGEYGATIYS